MDTNRPSDNRAVKNKWINIQVTLDSARGDREIMEDRYVVSHQDVRAERQGVNYAMVGVFDGHGGVEAAEFAKANLLDNIIKQTEFQSDDDETILATIKKGFLETHKGMERQVDTWPKTNSGFPSTSGTTATIGIFRKGRLYVAHVGDSGIVLGTEDPEKPGVWIGKRLTNKHKPNDQEELMRIQEAGGKVTTHRSGIPLVVWKRQVYGQSQEIPFFKLSRSLGDLWSYNSEKDVYIVSPDPDAFVLKIDLSVYRCVVFATKGVLDKLSPQDVVNTVKNAENHNTCLLLPCSSENAAGAADKVKKNPSTMQIHAALDICRRHPREGTNNMTVITTVFKPKQEENVNMDFLDTAFQQMNIDVGESGPLVQFSSATLPGNQIVATNVGNNEEEMDMD